MSLFGAIGDVVGSVIGAVSAHKENKINNQLSQRQFDAQMDETIQRRVADSLKAGINPLFALGYTGGASPTIHAGGGSSASPAEYVSRGFSNLGRHLDDALLDKQADDMEFDTQSKELDLESKRLHNRILRQELESKLSKPGQDEEPAPSMQGEELLFSPVYDIQGRPRLVINQNALEADSDNPGYMSSVISTIASGIKNGQIDPVSGEIRSSQMRMMLDDFYYQTTGHHIKNLESLYISPTEAAMAATMLARGVS